MKIYTRTGDDGTTGLFGGPRVAKHDLRIEAYGTIDELNAALGVCRALAWTDQSQVASEDATIEQTVPPPNGGRPVTVDATHQPLALPTEIDELLAEMQSDLFVMGAELAMPSGGSADGSRLPELAVDKLEIED